MMIRFRFRRQSTDQEAFKWP